MDGADDAVVDGAGVGDVDDGWAVVDGVAVGDAVVDDAVGAAVGGVGDDGALRVPETPARRVGDLELH